MQKKILKIFLTGIFLFLEGYQTAYPQEDKSTIQKIGEFLPYADKTLIELQKEIKNLRKNITKCKCQDGDFNLPEGFNFDINQTNMGYAFLKDPWNNESRFFNIARRTGIVGLEKNSTAYHSMVRNMNSGSSPKMTFVILAFDSDRKFIPDIIKTEPTYFNLYAYGSDNSLLDGFPIEFNPHHYVGTGPYILGTDSKITPKLVFGGLGLQLEGGYPVSNYPAGFEVNWVNAEIGFHSFNLKPIITEKSALKELSVAIKYKNKDGHVTIPLISKDKTFKNTEFSEELSALLGIKNIKLKIVLKESVDSYYCMIKIYKPTPNNTYKLLGNALLTTYKKDTLTEEPITFNMISDDLELLPDQDTELDLMAMYNQKPQVGSYQTNEQGILLINLLKDTQKN